MLQHRFIKSARSTSRLVELVDRYIALKARSPSKHAGPSKTLTKQAAGQIGVHAGGIDYGTMKSEWNFDETIRGTVKGMPVNLDLGEMSDEEEDGEWNMAEHLREDMIGTTRVNGVLGAPRHNVSAIILSHAWR